MQVQAGQPQTTTTQGEVTLPPAGTRLQYDQSPYRDVVFGIIFVLMILAMLIVVIADFAGTHISGDYGVIIGFLVLLMLIGGAAGVVGLQVIKCIPETIIKIVLWGLLGLYVLGGIVLIADTGEAGSGIFFFIVAAIIGIYMFIVWRRIPFAATLLWISARICTKYSGVLWIAIFALVLQFGFIILWIFFFVALYNGNEVVYILLVLSYYWGVQVFAMISHTTSCGVAATWYFYKDAPTDVTWSALKRTLTTSFGSVCFGSFIVAVVQTMRAMARSGGRNPCAIICLIILCCFEKILRFFTEYAFAYVAIYGQSYYQSAKMTFELLERRGWWALVNSTVVGIAIFGGSLVAALIVCVVGVIIGSGYNTATEIILGIIGFLVGYFMALVILRPVKSMVVALFVCYAEDPESMKQNHPDEYTRLTNAEPKLIVVVQVMMVQQPTGVVMMQPVGIQMQQPMGGMIVQPQMQVQMMPQQQMTQQQMMMQQQMMQQQQMQTQMSPQ